MTVCGGWMRGVGGRVSERVSERVRIGVDEWFWECGRLCVCR